MNTSRVVVSFALASVCFAEASLAQERTRRYIVISKNQTSVSPALLSQIRAARGHLLRDWSRMGCWPFLLTTPIFPQPAGRAGSRARHARRNPPSADRARPRSRRPPAWAARHQRRRLLLRPAVGDHRDRRAERLEAGPARQGRDRRRPRRGCRRHASRPRAQRAEGPQHVVRRGLRRRDRKLATGAGLLLQPRYARGRHRRGRRQCHGRDRCRAQGPDHGRRRALALPGQRLRTPGSSTASATPPTMAPTSST